MNKKILYILALILISILIILLILFQMNRNVISNNNLDEEYNSEIDNSGESGELIEYSGDMVESIKNSGDNNIVISGDELVYTLCSYNYGKYELPYINIVSEDVNNINNHFNELKKAIENGDIHGPDYDAYNVISYKCYINNDIVSLVIHFISDYGDLLNKYEVYNINKVTGKCITNSELLKLYNVSEEDILEIARSAYIEEFIERWFIDEELKTALRNGEKTNDTNINWGYEAALNYVPKESESLLIYVGENNELCVAAHRIQGMAGAVT